MRVAITHTRYTAKGGVERYAWDLVKRLLDAGHEVHYFCHFWDKQVDPRVHLHKIPNPWKQIRFMKVWSFDRWLTRHVRRSDFDVVHGFSKSSVQDIYTDGSGCLLDYQAYSIDERKGSSLAKKLRRASLHQRQVLAIEERRFTRGNFSKVVAMSDMAAQQIRSRYGLTADEVVTIYNGIDIERFNPKVRDEYRTNYRERIAASQEAFVALCVGNDYKRKGVPTLVEVARLIKERGGLPGGRPFRVAVVGKEKHKVEQELSDLCRAKGVYDRVKFYGPQDLVERWHAMADLFVLPSRFDAFGNVVLEAMATGVPVLVSSKAGAAEVVREGENGWVLPDPDDASAIADRVVQLAQDEAKRTAMGAKARATAETLSWDHHFAKMLALYEEVAAGKKAAKAVS
jgi:UDP-glucose:(heptosyl)LPS alpha-1,3-glucosyltransferase